jgi:hypothetical protein
MNDYYDGTVILSKKDINGKKPEIYLIDTNRSSGKTTYYNRLCVNRFLDSESKFCLIYRYNYELDEISDKFFKDIQGLFFHGKTMEDKRRANGMFRELFLDGKSCGYAISLNSSDQIKKLSHLFSDVDRMIFDEFQSETNHYCTDEVKKLLSVHTSIARGQGQQVRYVPVYMLSNHVSIINPYYTELGISERLRQDTRFLRGDGWVLQSDFLESASLAQKESGFNRAFSSNKYVTYSSENVYLNDNIAFIEKPVGAGKYLGTLKYTDRLFGIRQYDEQGIIYVDDRADSSFPNRITVTTADHEINYVMLRKNDLFLTSLRWYFEKGCFRFKDIRCKEATLKALSYNN